MPVSVILIDDHPLFRKGLTHLLESHGAGVSVAGQFAGIGEVTEWLQAGGRANVALLDRNLRDEDGLALVPELKRCDIKVIMLTVAEEPHEIRAALDRGVDGYVLKTSEPELILQTIFAVGQNLSARQAPVLDQSMQSKLTPDEGGKLTSRELEIVGLVAQGMSNKAIGDALGLSDNTVRNHLRSILEKLALDNRVQVATFALKHGIRPFSRGS